MILLDTHVLIWAVEGDNRLGQQSRTIIDAERGTDGALVSPITAWETAMLVNKGKLSMSRPVAGWFDRVLSSPGFRLADLTVSMGVEAGILAGSIHGDPADRLLIATARSLGCPFLTADRKILAYAKAGHVEAIDARR